MSGFHKLGHIFSAMATGYILHSSPHNKLTEKCVKNVKVCTSLVDVSFFEDIYVLDLPLDIFCINLAI